MNRLTTRRADNGLAYLVGVKPNEQEVSSPHPNTLRCILECFQSLAAYEDTGLTPGDVKDLQALREENGLAKYVDLIVQAKRQMGKANEDSIEQDERIEQLEAENARLRAELEQVKAERDAAIKEIYSFAACSICKHLSECDEIGGRCEGRDFGGCCNDDTIVPRFEWRGLEATHEK